MPFSSNCCWCDLWSLGWVVTWISLFRWKPSFNELYQSCIPYIQGRVWIHWGFSTKCVEHKREFSFGIQFLPLDFLFTVLIHTRLATRSILSVGKGISLNGGGQIQHPVPKFMSWTSQTLLNHCLRVYQLLVHCVSQYFHGTF